MAHISIAKDYELKYWRVHKDEPYDRAKKMIDLFNFPKNCQSAADIGSGPRGGIFHLYKASVMYAVDPLWKSYKKNNLAVIPQNVVTVSSEAENFALPEPVELAVSINALDHSGSLAKSVQNVMNNVKSGGLFFFHIHMRTKDQLNKGHRMLITESQIDDIFSPYSVLAKTIYDHCPIEFKPYHSYVAEVKKS